LKKAFLFVDIKQKPSLKNGQINVYAVNLKFSIDKLYIS